MAHEELEEGEKRTKRLNVNSRNCDINKTTDKKQKLWQQTKSKSSVKETKFNLLSDI